MKMWTRLFKKYGTLVIYLILGCFSTGINLVVYWASYRLGELGNIPSAILAWIAAVLAAFLTNKPLVFHSYQWSIRYLLPEMARFFGCRIATGLFELLFMYVSVDLVHANELLMKLLASCFALVLNYAASKLIVFVKRQ